MIKNNKKQFYIALAIVLSLFILSFLIMCFFYRYGNKSVSQDALDIVFKDGNRINLKNILPVGDVLGKTFNGQGTEEGVQGFVEFSIENLSDENVTYEIYLTKKDVSTKVIPDSFVKCFLTDEDDEGLAGFNGSKILTYDSFAVINNKADSKLLFRGNVNSRSKESFKLRSWLADTYVISQEPEEFDFTVGVRVV